MQTKGRPKQIVSVSAATTPEQRAEVLEMISELADSLAAMLGSDRSQYDDEVAHFEERYGGERGRAFVGAVDGVPAGCMLLRDSGDAVAELRRLYVRAPFRRKGVARSIVRAAEAEARALGYTAIRFVTSSRLEGAIELYRSEDYEPIPLYREVASETAAAFGKDL